MLCEVNSLIQGYCKVWVAPGVGKSACARKQPGGSGERQPGAVGPVQGFGVLGFYGLGFRVWGSQGFRGV